MQAPKLPSIFKHRGARPFDYKPRYYDERKERIEELKKKYGDKDFAAVESSIRERMRNEWRSQRDKQVGRSNTMLLGIIVGLFFLVYLIITY